MTKRKLNTGKAKQPEKKLPEPGKKPPKLFYLIMILIPVVFFILLELTLRIIDYGRNYETFLPASEYHTDKQFLNPDIPYKYFYNLKAAPSILPDGFDIIKKKDAFRVFVLGGSSTAGWPYVPNASFSRNLKRKLELFYPDNTIEVINLGISAINTYTIRDFVPGILEKQPDLILIYAGHNEYYGALGVGSSVSLGHSRHLVNSYLWLTDFKTTQLIQNIITWAYGIISGKGRQEGGEDNQTLMNRMVGESLIPYKSELYQAGIDQFQGNMDDILKMFKHNNIPVIIGNLTCNLKDLKPFISVITDSFPSAEKVYSDAKKTLSEGNVNKAKNLFLYAKELDALRFRAPQKINDLIFNLSKKYSYPFINIDSVFSDKSPYGIVGYNLTVDHLHPNIEGYRIIADLFYDKMERLNLLPKGKRNDISRQAADSILIKNFPLTKLDSTIAAMQIAILTNDFPFVPRRKNHSNVLNYKVTDLVDTIALKVINKELRWESAHATLSDYYIKIGKYAKAIKETEAVIAERPYYDIPYKDLISKLVDKNLLDEALPYLLRLNKVKSDYFSNKWLGQVLLKKNRYQEALNYLSEAVKFKEADSQTWYNLAGAQYLNGNTKSAIISLEKSLALNPKNQLAEAFYKQLKLLNR